MADYAVKYSAPAAIQTLLTTELNSLASGSAVLSGAIDNSAGTYKFINIEGLIAQQGGARTAGGYVAIQICVSVDGTNYCDATAPIPQKIAQVGMDAAVTARYWTRANISIPPCKFKLNYLQVTGQAFASSGNTLKYSLHAEQVSG